MSDRRAGPKPWWIVMTALAALGASAPEVVTVRVPSAKVSNWFPPGSDLRILPFDQFEALLKAARDRPAPALAPRLLKARHSARWDSGRLLGRTELTLDASSGGRAGLLVLEPWSPAVRDRGAGAQLLRATPDGRLALKSVPGGSSSVEFEWELDCRPGSRGRAFALDLPGVDLSSLTLDLPVNQVPDMVPGAQLRSEPNTEDGRASWRFEAATGHVDLRLRERSGDADRSDSSSLWLEGTTRIDLGAPSVNWQADWTLDESRATSRSLTIELDQGLEIVDVTGPRVASFRPVSDGTDSRFLIHLGGEGSGRSSLKIRGICKAPADGIWPVPSARPIDATWTGGRTLVRLDASRVLQSCQERSGRRVPLRPVDPHGIADLSFEPSGGPGPVADLTLRPPSSDATVQVRGRLWLGNEVPRIEAALTWSIEKGPPLALAADLPPGWAPDGVVTLARQQIPWHGESLGNGGTRIHLGPSPAGEGSRTLTLSLTASARQAGVTGPLDLPRVRPAAGARVVDEVWVATPDPGLAIRPILGTGLAWLDPPDPRLDDIPAPWASADIGGALAWRWLIEAAEARIDREPPKDARRGETRLEATIRQGRLSLHWSVEVELPPGTSEPIPIHLDETVEGPIRWNPKEPGGPVIEARPIDDARRALLGFPPTGGAWDLLPIGPSKGRIQLQGSVDRPWDGGGRIPLLTLPDRYRTMGIVALIVEKSTRVKLDTTGLAAIEPVALEDPSAPADGAPGSASKMRKAAVFGYGPTGGRLLVETTLPRFGPGGGIVREAFLLSRVSPGAGIHHRLTLGIAADSASTFAFTMPRGVAIDRLRREGLAVAPIPSGGKLLVEIPAPSPGRPLCSLSIEYRTGDDPRNGPIEPSHLLPACSLPCFGFAWEVVAPEPWVLSGVGGGLEATGPEEPQSVASTLLGFHWSPWSASDTGRAANEVGATIRDLDEAAAQIVDGEMNLGDWVLKLDAGRRPLIVDRLAIHSTGWGPGSRIVPSPAGLKSLGPVKSVLEPMGLTVLPLDTMNLITSKAAASGWPRDREAWSSVLKTLPAENSDASDRFQSAARWRGEVTPRPMTMDESTPSPDLGGRWHAWHLVSTAWPPPGASATLLDGRSDRAWGWFVAASVLVAGIFARGRPAKAQAFGLTALGVVVSIGLAWHWPASSSTFSGLLRGGLGVLAFGLGKSLRPHLSPTTNGPSEVLTTSRRSGYLAGLTHTPALLVAIGFGVTSAGGEAEAPILALLPFEGPADPSMKPDRVVMLVKDHERLERLARRHDPTEAASVSIAKASHKVGRDGPGLAIFESTYEIEVVGRGSATWILPVGSAFELSAVLDGRASPLAIAPDGLSAILALEGEGIHSLKLHRLVPLSAIGLGGSQARLPINRAAFAQVAVSRGAIPSWIEVGRATGNLSTEAMGIKGILGPLDALEVRWFPENRPPSADWLGPVEATFLWDARPVGDLIRMKLAHSEPDGLSAIRIAMEPGLMVRGHSIPGLVSIQREGTTARPEWVAQVDPPIPREVPIEVEFWRVAPTGREPRRWPAIDLPTAGKLTGLIGFRRPSDWSGRLEPRGGIEAASEASFVRAWGSLPDDGLTLAGAARYGRTAALEVQIHPVTSRRSIRSKVVLGLVPGRLEASIEGFLSDLQARAFELGVSIPNDLRVFKVEADGLLGWQRVASDHLKLQFDGSEVAERRIRIDAYLPAPAESPMSESRTFEAKVPWPLWEDAEATPGTLEITSPTRYQFDPAEGSTPLRLTAPPNPAEVLFRSLVRVDSHSGPSTVRWSSPPSKVNVQVESELSIEPSSMTWKAVLNCEVSGGPADSLNLSLPTEWAESATLEIEGMTHRLAAASNGSNEDSTQWKILPEKPIWGRARLVIRSRRPYRPGREFGYPQVAPLAATGRGSVGRYDVAILNGSGRTMEVAGSSGLQPIEASRMRSIETSSIAARAIGRAFHVTGDRWTLRLKVGRAGDESSSAQEVREARVNFARLACILERDGSMSGRAVYDLEPLPGPFLTVRLPRDATISWMSVDDDIGRALIDTPGRWMIPLGDGEPRRVTLAWHLPASALPTLRQQPLELPTLDRSSPPTLIGVEVPKASLWSVPERGLEWISHVDWELADIEQSSRCIIEALGDLDRTSRRDRESILEELMKVELRVRQASRSPVGNDRPDDLTTSRVRAALSSIDEASQAAGLDDLIQEARARIGVTPPEDESVERPSAFSPEVIRIRRSGDSHYFRSPSGDLGRIPMATRIEDGPNNGSRTASWAIGVGGSLGSLTLGGLMLLGFRPSGWLPRSLAILTTLALLSWEPIGAISALGLFAWGRLSG